MAIFNNVTPNVLTQTRKNTIHISFTGFLLIPLLIVVGCSQGVSTQGEASIEAERVAIPTVSPVQPDATPKTTTTPERTPLNTKVKATTVPIEFDAEVIYSRELYRGLAFSSAEAWTQKLDEWVEKQPPHPGLFEAAKGVSAALRVGRAFVGDSSVLNDKWQHCVLGAEIGRSSTLESATFVAWLKEFQDLTDARPSTGFDEIDYDATVDGARQSNSALCDNCHEVCATRWGIRDKGWNGTTPY